MDRCFLALLAPLIAWTPLAFADSRTDLTISGVITPSACTPSLSDGGIVNHGKVTVKDLDANQPTRLDAGTLFLQVSCEAATVFTLTTLDNRGGTSAIHPTHHGLGLVNDDQKLGSVALGVFDTIADGAPVKAIMSRDDGANWRVSSYLGHAGLTAFAAVDEPGTPVPIKLLNARITAFTTITRANDLTLTDEIPIDGHITLQLNY